MSGDLARRLDKIEAAHMETATVLRLEDGTRAILPRAAMLWAWLGFMNLAHGEGLSWDGKPIPMKWVRVFARSVPQASEGMLTGSCRELSRRYLNGEDLTA